MSIGTSKSDCRIFWVILSRPIRLKVNGHVSESVQSDNMNKIGVTYKTS